MIFPGEQFGLCPRCQRKFIPGWNEHLAKFDRCCRTCMSRNILDSMGAPEMYERMGIKRDRFSNILKSRSFSLTGFHGLHSAPAMRTDTRQGRKRFRDAFRHCGGSIWNEAPKHKFTHWYSTQAIK